MQDAAIGRRYARALALALDGQDEATLTKIESELQAIGALLEDKKSEMRVAMLNPSVGRDQRKQILGQVADAHGFAPAAKTMLLLLVDKDRIRSLPAVARAFRTEVDAKTGRVRAKITSAKPLDDEAMKALVNALQARTGKAVLPEVSVDPSVISGVQARIGGLVFDATVRSQLERLKHDFMQ